MRYRKVILPDGVEAYENEVGNIFPFTDRRTHFIAINAAAADTQRVPPYLDELTPEETEPDEPYFYDTELRMVHKYTPQNTVYETAIKRRIALDWAVIAHEREMRKQLLNQTEEIQ